MAFQTIHTAESNFLANLFTLEEGTAETSNSNWLPINCCDYGSQPFFDRLHLGD